MNMNTARDLITPPDLSKEVTHCSTFIATCIKPGPDFISLGKAQLTASGMQEKYRCSLDNRVYVVTIKPES